MFEFFNPGGYSRETLMEFSVLLKSQKLEWGLCYNAQPGGLVPGKHSKLFLLA
jgi:hypothetical protein